MLFCQRSIGRGWESPFKDLKKSQAVTEAWIGSMVLPVGYVKLQLSIAKQIN